MAKSHLRPMPMSGRPSDHSEGGGRVWRWVFLSGLAHVVIIAILLLTPFQPSKAPNYPVYTVDLVGGEKLGGGAGTEVASAPELKKEIKKAKEETPPRPQVTKESKKKTPEVRAEMTEKVATKAKKEAEKAESEKVKERLKQLREKRIEEAVAEIKSRAESEQKKQPSTAPTSTVVADKPGAAAPGAGGTGGGVVKSPEYVKYYSEMKARIKNSWTWVGRRTDLTVTVSFSVQDNGEISSLKITRSSGDPSYDDSVIRALRRSSPLAPPPESYRKEFMDVELAFTPKELGG